MLGEVVKLLDTIVTQNATLGTSFSLDLLRIVQAFPDQVCQWATLHLIEPRSRAAQLWGLGVFHALARLQHPLTFQLWEVVKDSDIDLPVSLYIELCFFFGLPAGSKNSNEKSGRYRSLSKSEKAAALQSVLQRAKATGNTLIILTCWNHTIQGLLSQDDIQGAEREWLALQRLGHSPPIELLQAFIRYYSKRVKQHPEYVEKVSGFHARIKMLNMSPDLQTYSEIMKCYERSMRYKDMDAVLLEMTQEELRLHASQDNDDTVSQLPRGIRVRGPRATQLSSSLDASDPSEWPSDPSLLEDFITEKHQDSVTSPSGSEINASDVDMAAIKARRASAARSSEADALLKVGNLVYTGGAQWAGGGRKHPARTNIVQSVEKAFNPSPIVSPPSDPTATPLALEVNASKLKSKREEEVTERRAKLVSAWSRAIYSALSLGSLRKAMLLVEEMQMLGLEVNDRICTEFMFYAGKRNQLQLLETWWSRLTRLPDTPLRKKHYLILMREYLRMNKDVEARAVMTKLCHEFGHYDDAYALWLRYYSNRGFNVSAENTLRQMQANNVEYGIYSISALMEMFAKRGDQDEMFGWLERLKKSTQSNHAIDDVVSKCAYHFLQEGHDIGTVSTWLESLPAAAKYFPRTLAALMVIVGSQQKTHALGQLAALCTDIKSAHILVGLVRAHSLVPASPKRDHTIVDILKTCGSIKFSLTAPQNDEIMQALMKLPMPTVLLDWTEELIAHPSHVAEPTPTLYHLAATASLDTNTPERFVALVSKASDKYGTLPPLATSSAVVRSICTTHDLNRILFISAPLISLYPQEAQSLLAMIDRELSAIDVPRPKGVPSPSQFSNPSTVDVPSYLARRLGLTK